MCSSEAASLEHIERLPVDEVLIDVEPAAPSESSAKDQPLSIAALLAPHTTASGSSPDPARIAVATMTKQPLAFETWLTYHRQVLGIEKFYLRVEDTPSLAQLLATPPWDRLVDASFHEGAHLVQDNGTEQTSRQDAHVKEAIVKARAAGCTHILHIDDDELLYAPSGVDALRRELGAGDGAGAAGIVNVHALTLEALYPPALDGAGTTILQSRR